MRTRLKQAVSGEILMAAEAVLGEQGVHAAGVAEIAARAGVSVGTLYNHFADRKALVQALFKLRREQLAPRLVAMLEAGRGQPMEARLSAFLRDVFVLFDEHRNFMRVASEAEYLKPAERQGTPAPVMIRLLDCIAEIMASGGHELDPDGLPTRFTLAAIKGVVQRGLLKGTPFAADAGAAAELILYGVAPRG